MIGPNTTAALGTVTPGGTGDDGYPAPDTVTWAAVDAVWWPGGSSEKVNGQDQVTWQNTICFPTGTIVKATDKVFPTPQLDSAGNLVLGGDGVTPVSADGVSTPFSVDGEPSTWPANPFTGRQEPYSVVVNLTRVTG